MPRVLLWKMYGKVEYKDVKSLGFCIESIAKNKSLREIVILFLFFPLFLNWITESFVFIYREKSIFLNKLHIQWSLMRKR